jgi:hypothetical protein
MYIAQASLGIYQALLKACLSSARDAPLSGPRAYTDFAEVAKGLISTEPIYRRAHPNPDSSPPPRAGPEKQKTVV